MDPNANIAEQVKLAREMVTDNDGESIDTGDAVRLAELVIALDEWRSKGGFEPAAAPASADATKWNFWLPDSDRSTGWTNHGYVLQFVCAGYGDTPDAAWESAKRAEVDGLGVPEGFHLPDTVVAIREGAEWPLEVT